MVVLMDRKLGEMAGIVNYALAAAGPPTLQYYRMASEYDPVSS